MTRSTDGRSCPSRATSCLRSLRPLLHETVGNGARGRGEHAGGQRRGEERTARAAPACRCAHDALALRGLQGRPPRAVRPEARPGPDELARGRPAPASATADPAPHPRGPDQLRRPRVPGESGGRGALRGPPRAHWALRRPGSCQHGQERDAARDRQRRAGRRGGAERSTPAPAAARTSVPPAPRRAPRGGPPPARRAARPGSAARARVVERPGGELGDEQEPAAYTGTGIVRSPPETAYTAPSEHGERDAAPAAPRKAATRAATAPPTPRSPRTADAGSTTVGCPRPPPARARRRRSLGAGRDGRGAGTRSPPRSARSRRRPVLPAWPTGTPSVLNRARNASRCRRQSRRAAGRGRRRAGRAQRGDLDDREVVAAGAQVEQRGDAARVEQWRHPEDEGPSGQEPARDVGDVPPPEAPPASLASSVSMMR